MADQTQNLGILGLKNVEDPWTNRSNRCPVTNKVPSIYSTWTRWSLSRSRLWRHLQKCCATALPWDIVLRNTLTERDTCVHSVKRPNKVHARMASINGKGRKGAPGIAGGSQLTLKAGRTPTAHVPPRYPANKISSIPCADFPGGSSAQTYSL